MVLKKVEDTETEPEKKVKIVVVSTLPTQEVREGVVNGVNCRFITVEEALSLMLNQN